MGSKREKAEGGGGGIDWNQWQIPARLHGLALAMGREGMGSLSAGLVGQDEAAS